MRSTIIKAEPAKEAIKINTLVAIDNDGNGNDVVLVTRVSDGNFSGVVVSLKEGSRKKLGYYSDTWDINSFTKLPVGTAIQLENEPENEE